MKRIVLFILLSISFVVGASTTTIYDFSVRTPGSNIYAYQGTSGSKVPSSNSIPSSQFSSSDYVEIASNNNVYHDFINYTKNIYPATRYVIEVDEVVNTITELNVLWNGYGVNSKNNKSDGVLIYIWNYTNNTYDYLMGSTSDGIIEINQSKTANIADYFGNSNEVIIYVVAQEKTFNKGYNWIGTDYFSLSVTADATLSPIANYYFDECSYTGFFGDTADQMANYSATSQNSMTSISPGIVGSAANITDYSQHFTTSIPLASDFTISTWFKKTTSNTGSDYFVLGAMEGGGDLLVLDRSNGWYWGIYDGLNTTFSTTYTFASLDDNWHHMVVMYQSGISYLVIDGVWVDTINKAPSGTLKYIGTSFDFIGTNDAQGFRAPLDEFMVFNQTLSLSEMQSIYNNQLVSKNYDGTTRAEASCTYNSKYNLEESTWSGSNSILDSSGNDNHASPVGSISSTLVAPISCQAVDIPNNSTLSSRDAIDTGVDVNSLGDQGSIAFWYRNNTEWDNNAPAKVLFDASTSSDAQFLMYIWPGGYLEFEATEPDGDRIERYTKQASISADAWVHIVVTWDATSNDIKIYVNGVSQSLTHYLGNTLTQGLNLNLDTLYFGDNNSTTDSALGGSADGSIDEIQLFSHVLTSTEVNTVYADVTECANTVDHYQIIHDGNGLTCDAETVTIKACTNAYDGTCTLSTEAVTLDVKVTGSSSTINNISFIGTGTASIPYTTAESTVLSLENTSIAATNSTVCLVGSSTNCNLVFADAGFRFLNGSSGTSETISNQVGGTSFPIRLQAVKNSSGVCTGLFTGNKNVDLSQENVSPSGNAGLNFTVNGSNIAKHQNGSTNTTLNFGSDSIASIPTAMYLDAGQISLHASYNVGGVSLTGSSNAFWVSPFKLVASAQSGGSDINGNTDSSSIKHKAGQVFDFTVTAYNALGTASGNITTNYTPNNMQLLLTRTGPNSGGADGSFNYGAGAISSAIAPTYQAVTLNAFSGGSSNSNSATYSEVGLLNLDLQDVDYGFSGNTISGDAIDIGRFTPDHFDVSITDNSFENACSIDVPSYTYIGQPFSYLNAPLITITAKNALGVTTQNYTEASFQKLAANDINRTFPISDTAKNGADNATKMVVVPTTQVGSLTKLSNGVLDYEFSTTDSFTYSKDSNSEVAEFVVDYDILINSITDSDGVSINAANTLPLTIQPSGGFQRFGRLVLSNSFGSETSALAQNFETQYVNALGVFTGNTNDNCSLITKLASNWTLSNPTNNVTINNVTISGTDGSLSDGKFQSVFLSSGNNQGTIDIEYITQDWLKYNWSNKVSNLHDENTSATATFGVYRGNDRIISWREVGN